MCLQYQLMYVNINSDEMKFLTTHMTKNIYHIYNFIHATRKRFLVINTFGT